MTAVLLLLRALLGGPVGLVLSGLSIASLGTLYVRNHRLIWAQQERYRGLISAYRVKHQDVRGKYLDGVVSEEERDLMIDGLLRRFMDELDEKPDLPDADDGEEAPTTRRRDDHRRAHLRRRCAGHELRGRRRVRVAATEGHEVVGVRRGYQGLIDEQLEPLTHRLADGRLAPTRPVELNFGLGGSFLGTARCRAFYQAEGRAAAAKVAKRFDGLVVIGGNGSLAGAHALHEEHGIPVVGIPASIDHDIGCTGTALGVDSALNTIVEACDRISDTARATGGRSWSR